MGIGPAPATQKLLDRLGLSQDHRRDRTQRGLRQPGLAVLRQLGIADDDMPRT
jgi:acetyl-CoA acyltransferase